MHIDSMRSPNLSKAQIKKRLDINEGRLPASYEADQEEYKVSTHPMGDLTYTARPKTVWPNIK